MAEREQQELQRGFQKLGDNIDKMYARPVQKVRVLLVPLLGKLYDILYEYEYFILTYRQLLQSVVIHGHDEASLLSAQFFQLLTLCTLHIATFMYVIRIREGKGGGIRLRSSFGVSFSLPGCVQTLLRAAVRVYSSQSHDQVIRTSDTVQ